MKCRCGNKLKYEKFNQTFYCDLCNTYFDINMNTISEEEVYYKTTQKQIQNFNQTQSPKVTCPYCQSTNTQKISGLSKAGSVALWGIFALGKTTKQWHCNNCKSDF